PTSPRSSPHGWAPRCTAAWDSPTSGVSPVASHWTLSDDSGARGRAACNPHPAVREKRRCSRRIPDRRLGKARPARDPRHFISLEALWEEPSCAAFLEGLSSFSRVILMDRRGVGLSDPVTAGDPPTIEQWMDDIVAVLDAVGSGPR